MTKKRKIYLIATILFSLTLIGVVYGKNINKKNGFNKTIKSSILNENRNILIHLPDNYESSNTSYPVIYQFDGNKKQIRKTVSAINKLSRKVGRNPEMIVVAIESIKRDKDFWPTHTRYYPDSQPLGSQDFLKFIEKELIPYIESNYRTNENRIICGQSLSAVFTLYTFLSKPYLFNSYIACSGAFPGCEPFFKELSNKAFQQTEQFKDKKIFITHGLKDPLDPEGKIHQQMTEFSKTITANLGTVVSCKYLFYENEGHVPKNSLKDGLTYLFE